MNEKSSNENSKEIYLVDLLVNSGLAKCRSVARRLIVQGCIYINDKKVEDIFERTC